MSALKNSRGQITRPSATTLLLLSCAALLVAPRCVAASSDPSPKDTLESFLTRRGLPFEEHSVTTDDGYILLTHRLPNPGAPVVYLQHGILADTWCWISNTNELGIGQSLHAAGYDVWMGNSRGNSYGRNHTTLDVKRDKEFWAFSFAEMARHDLPATIEYIVAATGQEEMVYVGWSQANTAMLIAMQEPGLRDFLEKRVSLAVMLSPVAYMKHSSSLLLSAVSEFHLGAIVETVFPYGVLSPEPGATGINEIEQFFCKVTLGLLCKISVDAVCGTSSLDDSHTVTNAFTSKFPAGTSVHDLVHYEQFIGEFPSIGKAAQFREYDFGTKKKNVAHYGVPEPPSYNLSDMAAVPLAIFAGEKDALVSAKDYAQLLRDLAPSGKIAFNQTYAKFSHLTWMVGVESAWESWHPDFMRVIKAATAPK